MRNHQPTITTNGEDCLKVYHEDCQNNRLATEKETCSQPGLIKMTKSRLFDVVLLDCNMPCINGIEVAKEILAVNPHQRIIFASAYVKDTVTDSIIKLKQLKECIQKPFGMQELVDLIEDKRIYEELQRHNVDLDVIKALNTSHEQIVDLLDRLQNV
jgi:CheY-like chemotaxis protein